MKRHLMLLALGASLLLLFPSSISQADGGEDHVLLSNSPIVTVNLSNNTIVNVTYSQIFAGTDAGVVGASFGAQAWNITNTSSGYQYRSSFDLLPVTGSDSADLYRQIMNLSDKNKLGNESTPSIRASVTVSVSHYTGPVSVLSVRNITSLMNSSISNVNISTLKLSFSVNLNLAAQTAGNVDIVLVQSLSGKENSNAFGATGVDTYEKSSELGSGVALLNNSLSDLRAVYWWNNNFTYNGNNGSDYAVLIPGESSTQIAFVFKTVASQGQYSLAQDPYLSVNGANLGVSPIKILTQPVINFFLQHVEFFAVGVAVGSTALVAMYGAYRRNRIKL